MKKKSKRLKLGDLPVGVSIASGLLNFFAVLVLLPMAGLGFFFIAALADLSREDLETKGEAMWLPAVVAMMVLFYSMLTAALWLAKYLRAIHFRGDPSRAPRRPSGSLKTNLEPVLFFTVGLSVLALACVIRSWAWSLLWVTIAGTCGFLIYLLNRKRSD